jgi:hypothetical protein
MMINEGNSTKKKGAYIWTQVSDTGWCMRRKSRAIESKSRPTQQKYKCNTIHQVHSPHNKSITSTTTNNKQQRKEKT